jgi:hypothetical protein
MKLSKAKNAKASTVTAAIEDGMFDLMICVPSMDEPDREAYRIRRLAVDNHIPLVTNAETGRLLLTCLSDKRLQDMTPMYWHEGDV